MLRGCENLRRKFVFSLQYLAQSMLSINTGSRHCHLSVLPLFPHSPRKGQLPARARREIGYIVPFLVLEHSDCFWEERQSLEDESQCRGMLWRVPSQGPQAQITKLGHPRQELHLLGTRFPPEP